jgi:hypothetical protein
LQIVRFLEPHLFVLLIGSTGSLVAYI